MTILGHDVDGRPLRAGDRVMVVKSVESRRTGVTTQVVGPAPRGVWSYLAPNPAAFVEIDIPHPHHPHGWVARGTSLRRLDDRTDHQPSEFTFDSLMDHLKQGAPDHA